MEIQKQGSVYSWHANKQIAFILIKQGNKQEAVEYLKDKYKKIKSPSLYEIFDFAEFLKNNENYDDSIKYYSQLLSLIDKKHDLYAQVLDGRGIAYERTNQWDKAEVDLLGSLESSPNDAYVINYLASNFYLNLANYLNPNFQSYTTLYAENFYNIEEFDKAKELYVEIQKQGSVYSWHANKQIAFILIKQGNKQEAVKYLKDKYQKIKSPSLYEIFDFAEFLKNNENYDDSIKY